MVERALIIAFIFLAGCNSKANQMEDTARNICASAIKALDGIEIKQASGKAWVRKNVVKVQYLQGPDYRCYVENGLITEFEKGDASIINQVPKGLKAK